MGATSGRRTRTGARRTTILLAVAVALLGTACRPILLPDGSRLPANPARPGNVGANVGWVADHSTELPFVDAVKMARPWVANRTGLPWGQGGPLAVDRDGWVTHLEPGQYATMRMLDVGGRYPAGRWVLRWQGTGTLRLEGGAARVVSQAPGRWEVDLTPQPTGGIVLHLLETDPDDPVRHIELLMPGHEATAATQPFNPVFLQRLQPFDTIRFTWWMRRGSQSNGPGANATWADRTLPTEAFQTERGVALEYQVMLANQLDADAWLHVPHDADDQWVAGMAALVRDRLEPGRRAYVEYSNETWNGGTPQAQWVVDHGLALGLATDPFQAGLRYHALRAGQIHDIWESVLGGRERFVRVVSAQAGNPWTGRQVLEQAGGSAGADVIAIAPYFHCVRRIQVQPDGLEQVLAMTDDELLAACEEEVRVELPPLLQQWKALADQHGVELVAYESGQHLIGVTPAQVADPALSDKFARVNRTQRMGDLYTEYLALWRSVGGGQLVAFAPVAPYRGAYGAFGGLEFQDQDPATAPKYLALVAAAAGA